MEDWVRRALARWPNVPALFGWLGLDRRGRWLIRGELISRPQIIDTLNRNYAADAHGRWYFQNGPQRGYVQLDCAPFVLRAQSQTLVAHTGETWAPQQVLLDEEGSVLVAAARGLGLLADTELDWALRQLRGPAGAVDEAQLATALALLSGATTALHFHLGDERWPLRRLDAARMPAQFGFVREPQPLPGEGNPRSA